MEDKTREQLEDGALHRLEASTVDGVASNRLWQRLIIAIGTIGCSFGVFDRWWLAKDYSRESLIRLGLSEMMVIIAAVILVGSIGHERKLRQEFSDELWRALEKHRDTGVSKTVGTIDKPGAKAQQSTDTLPTATMSPEQVFNELAALTDRDGMEMLIESDFDGLESLRIKSEQLARRFPTYVLAASVPAVAGSIYGLGGPRSLIDSVAGTALLLLIVAAKPIVDLVRARRKTRRREELMKFARQSYASSGPNWMVSK